MEHTQNEVCAAASRTIVASDKAYLSTPDRESGQGRSNRFAIATTTPIRGAPRTAISDAQH